MYLFFSYTKYVSIGLIVLMLGYKIWKLNHINFDLDILEKQLQPLKKCIKPGSVIGVYISNNDGSIVSRLQYVLAPVIITNNTTTDTLLFVQSKLQPANSLNNYRIIKQSSYQNSVISLITKTR